MAYCVYTEIKQLTGTVLSQSDIEEIILQGDREIDAVLEVHGLTGGSDDTIKGASIKLATAGVMTRHRMDGTQPASRTVADATRADTLDAAIKGLRTAAFEMVDKFVEKNETSKVEDRYVYRVNK